MEAPAVSLPKARWGILAVAVLVAALGCWWFVTPPPLTPIEQSLVGTWTSQVADNPSPVSHVTFKSDRSCVQTIFDNGPDAAPTMYHFRNWRVEADTLVVEQLHGSLLDRLTGRTPPPKPTVVGLESMTPKTITLHNLDGSRLILTRPTTASERPSSTRP
jgi:hypothetical protein